MGYQSFSLVPDANKITRFRKKMCLLLYLLVPQLIICSDFAENKYYLPNFNRMLYGLFKAKAQDY